MACWEFRDEIFAELNLRRGISRACRVQRFVSFLFGFIYGRRFCRASFFRFFRRGLSRLRWYFFTATVLCPRSTRPEGKSHSKNKHWSRQSQKLCLHI